MNFSVEHLEFYMLVLVRISAFIFAAPFFGIQNIPAKVKLGLSAVLTIVVVQTIGVTSLQYTGVIGYCVLILKEAAVGVALGYIANICLYILNFAGQIIDMEIGLSMVNMFDPSMNVQGTISGSMYSYFIMLMLLATNMHYFILRAIIDSFHYFNVGKAVFSESVKQVIVDFMPNYFIIGFRIVLPVFGAMLLINVVLGVLAKAAPQMNMFVVGLQLKVIVGLVILFLIMQALPGVSSFIGDEMKQVLTQMMRAFTPT